MHKKILVSLCGYMPDMKKTALCITTSNTFSVIDEKKKIIVFSGTLSKPVFSDEMGEYVKTADFTSFAGTGRFYVKCGFRRSDTFEISEGLYSGFSSVFLSGIYLNRCGYDFYNEKSIVFSGYSPYFRESCHAEMIPLFFGENKIDVSGGWHCGGGYQKSVTETALACAFMLYSLRLFPEAFSSDNMYDLILAECRWGIEWLLKMQSEDGGVYHKCDTPRFISWPDEPGEDKGEYYVFPKSYKAALFFTAVTALASKVFEKSDVRFSRKLSRAASNGWLWIVNCPDYEPWSMPSGASENGIADIPDRDSSDDYMWVLSEMFSLTGDDLFERRFLRLLYETDSSGFSLNRTGGFASLSYLLNDDKRDASALFYIKKKFGDRADRVISECAVSGGGAFTDVFPERSRYDDYSNLRIISDCIACETAYMIFGTEKYLTAAVGLFQYILGKNPMGISYVTGLAEASPKRPFHALSSSDENDLPVPGMVVGGSNFFHKDVYSAWLLRTDAPPAECYIDSEFSRSNEPSVCYGASALLASAFFYNCRSRVLDDISNK